jgi:L-threonylcarbamoyladenylate synthase
MKIVPFEQFLDQQDYFVKEAKAWKVFVYPTDTIYGIGGIINQSSINTIHTIKQRSSWKHYSIIAPSYLRVEKHFEVEEFEKYWNSTKRSLKQWRWLTILCPLKPKYEDSIWLVSSNNLIWIRFLDHLIQWFISEIWEGFISTSCNISGQNNIKEISQITSEQKKLIDYAIDSWKKEWSWSVIINYNDWKVVRD